ncbi:MAG: NapC/NirT family cytochrome c [Gammaproteobacteria bacterium]
MSSESEKKGSVLWKRPSSKWLLGIPIGGFLMLVVGAAGLLVMNTVLHVTSTTEFCLSCHTHTVNSVDEYEASSHANNASGVRAQCADCHLPNPEEHWFRYVGMKMIVSLDIIAEIRGIAHDPADYEAHRGPWAKKVWIEYRENKSEFCLHCHAFDHMVEADQPRMAQRRHSKAEERGQSCIDCHQGIVHKLPENWDQIWNEVEEETAYLSPEGSGEDNSRLASKD